MQLQLLSIKELMEESEESKKTPLGLRQMALRKIDEHRREKVLLLKSDVAICQALGAGLLLQLAAQGKERRVWSVAEALEVLDEPVQIEYVYGAHGKPDFADLSRHFNLSHSGEYIVLVTDEHPVGVDIQNMRPLKNYHLAERYFSEKELSKLEVCATASEKVECFYDIWVKKESYAKLTGEGIGLTIKFDTEDADLQVCWHAFEAPEGYRLAVCSNLSDKKEM